MLIPANQFNNRTNDYLIRTNKKIIFLYFLLVSILLTIILSLPFLYIDITVLAPGIIRPARERTAIKSSIPAYLDSIYYSEGELAIKNSILFSFKKDNLSFKNSSSSFLLQQLRNFIDDLKLISKSSIVSKDLLKRLKTDLYKAELMNFISEEEEHIISVKKADEELKVDAYLLKEKVISVKDYLEKQTSLDRLKAAHKSLQAQQRVSWQQQLSKIETEVGKMKVELSELQFAREAHELRAPVTGVIQYVNTHYPGSFIQPGEILCLLSPQTELIAECIVSSMDVGMIRRKQKVSFKVDAFNYSYFGMLTGKVLSIDNDFTLSDNKPVFKVRCEIDNKEIRLSNGFLGELKKGLTVQASFILTRRSLWQLIFDKLDDWLNPAAAKPGK